MGNRALTIYFLREFERFMILNEDLSITCHPNKKCSYFLSFFEGTDICGWVEAQDDWLLQVSYDPSELPLGMTSWDVMRQEFLKAFTDHLWQERAYHELSNLKMKDACIDEYIAQYSLLMRQAKIYADDVNNINMFA